MEISVDYSGANLAFLETPLACRKSPKLGLRRLARIVLIFDSLPKGALAQKLELLFALRSDGKGICKLSAGETSKALGTSPERFRVARNSLERSRHVDVRRHKGRVSLVTLRLRGDAVLACEARLAREPLWVARLRAALAAPVTSARGYVALVGLAVWSVRDGAISFPVQELAAKLRMGNRQMQRVFAEICQAGFISVEERFDVRGGNLPNVIALNAAKLGITIPAEAARRGVSKTCGVRPQTPTPKCHPPLLPVYRSRARIFTSGVDGGVRFEPVSQPVKDWVEGRGPIGTAERVDEGVASQVALSGAVPRGIAFENSACR